MTRADLLRRLRRAQSLAQRGATEGERAAAALAVERLTRRLDALPPGDDDEAPTPRRGFDGLPWAADGAAAPDRAARCSSHPRHAARISAAGAVSSARITGQSSRRKAGRCRDARCSTISAAPGV